MPIQFTCPHCGAETNVADEYAGRSGPCATCGRTIIIPSAAAQSVTDGPSPADGSAAAKAAKGPSGVLIAVIVLVCVLVVFVACGGILTALLLPAIQGSREAARKTQCANNLRQISLALFMYNESYDCFPPAYVADETGKPIHSWRVLILPFLGHQTLYDRYDFGAPWNSPSNRAVTSTPLEIYRCPNDEGSDPLETNYVMIVGAGTFGSGGTPRHQGELRDGAAGTIMLVETADSGIHWAEPRDLKAEQMSFEVNADKGPGLRSRHAGGVNVALCDGSVRFLNESTDPEQLEAMTTIDAGDPVAPVAPDY